LLNPFYRLLLLTLSLVMLYRLGILTPIPFVDHDVLGELFGRYQPFDRDASKRVSIFALGLMPYVSASVVVEIFALFVPVLKTFRRGSLRGRRKLKRIALSLTLGLAAFQAYGVARGMQNSAFRRRPQTSPD
jgi:preprotein translocase subunit SecY